MNILKLKLRDVLSGWKLAKWPSLQKGAAMIRYGKTEILAVASASKKPREGMDFFPLSCDYEEKQYSVGNSPAVLLSAKAVRLNGRSLNSG